MCNFFFIKINDRKERGKSTCEGVIDFIDKSIAYNEQPQKGNV